METGAMLQRKQVGEFLDWDLGKDVEAKFDIERTRITRIFYFDIIILCLYGILSLDKKG